MTQIITENNSQEFLYRNGTYAVIELCMVIHTELGEGFLEIVYKDALEFEFKRQNITYHREKEYEIVYQGFTLPHKFYADFVIDHKIILEVEANDGGLANEHIAKMINYLKVSGCKVGLLINFGRNKLEHRI